MQRLESAVHRKWMEIGVNRDEFASSRSIFCGLCKLYCDNGAVTKIARVDLKQTCQIIWMPISSEAVYKLTINAIKTFLEHDYHSEKFDRATIGVVVVVMMELCE